VLMIIEKTSDVERTTPNNLAYPKPLKLQQIFSHVTQPPSKTNQLSVGYGYRLAHRVKYPKKIDKKENFE